MTPRHEAPFLKEIKDRARTDVMRLIQPGPDEPLDDALLEEIVTALAQVRREHFTSLLE